MLGEEDTQPKERSREERDAEVRCLGCLGHFRPPSGADHADCPHCGASWRLTWLDAHSVKIRGPWKKS